MTCLQIWGPTTLSKPEVSTNKGLITFNDTEMRFQLKIDDLQPN